MARDQRSVCEEGDMGMEVLVTREGSRKSHVPPPRGAAGFASASVVRTESVADEKSEYTAFGEEAGEEEDGESRTFEGLMSECVQP